MKKYLALALAVVFALFCFGCSAPAATTEAPKTDAAAPAADAAVDFDSMTLDQLLEKSEGYVGTAGLPDYWTLWSDSFATLKEKYGIDRNVDPDLSSAEELALFIAEKDDPTMDLGDIGYAFTVTAVEQDCIQPYTVDVWDKIPDWAKDPDHKWALSYTGSTAFIFNDAAIEGELPTTWKELLEREDINLAFGNVIGGATSQVDMLAMNFALGGTWDNIRPCIDKCIELAKAGRLDGGDAGETDFETGQIVCGCGRFDFNGSNFAKDLNEKNIPGVHISYVIPQDGALSTGYALVLNKWAAHPYAARVALNYLFSDEGQIDRARGGARPIRADQIDIPDDCPILGDEYYQNIITPESAAQLNAACEAISEAWENEVVPLMG